MSDIVLRQLRLAVLLLLDPTSTEQQRMEQLQRILLGILDLLADRP